MSQHEGVVLTQTKTASITSLEHLNFLHDDNLQLLYSLHKSLDSRNILEEFFEGIQSRVKCDGFSYKHGDKQIVFNFGHISPHQLNYHLTTDQDDLGKITFSRETVFEDQEVLLLEDLLCLLINPLRNAIEHLTALRSALHDPLTGVHNRTALEPALNRDIDLAKRHTSDVSVLLLDLDHFKKVNDTYGHPAGDAVLIAFTNSLQEIVRDSDMVFRFGGEEFIILLSKTDTEGAIKLADRICKTIANLTTHYHEQSIKTTVSIGVASLMPGDTNLSLLEKADQALYRAKHEGRNRVSI